MLFISFFSTQISFFPFAILVDYLLREPPNAFHPVMIIGKYISFWSHVAFSLFYNPNRKILLFLLGTIMTISGTCISIAFVLFLLKMIEPYPLLYFLIGVFLLKTSFSTKQLFFTADEIFHVLNSGDLDKARQLTAFHLVSRDTSTLSENQVVSAVIESLAENIVDSIISPLFYYLLGGLPLAWSYRFVNTADAMVGYHSEKYEYFGKFSAKLDDILNFIPARLSGLLIIIAAFLCRYNALNAYRTMLTQSKNTLSPNAGIPMSAVAGALEITLEKVNHYQLKGADATPNSLDIQKAIHLLKIAVALWYIICLLIGIFFHWRIIYP
jgi:adenosylcobinamide-phosphate synthase